MKNHIKPIILFLSFFIVFVFKVAEVEYLTRLEYSKYPQSAGGRWANTGGDSFSYIGAMENYITKGSYYFLNENGDTVKAGRLPHYAIPYFLLRQVFSPSAALDVFVLFQLAIESIAAVCLALLACSITKNKRSYFVSLALSIVSLYITVWSYNTYTDAVSSNLLLIAAYLYYQYQDTRSQKQFLYFSIVFGMVVCLRPYFSLLYILIGLAELYNERASIGRLLKKMVLAALPLVLLLAPWVIRNLQVMHRFFLFQQDMYAGYAIDENELIARKTLTQAGEEGSNFWDKKAAASYFLRRAAGVSNYVYPVYIKNDPETVAAFEAFRTVSMDSTATPGRVKQASAVLIGYYKSRYPVRFYLFNHLRPFMRFLFHNGSYRLPADINNTSQLLLKLTQSLLYYCCLVFGTIGLVKLANKSRRSILFLVPAAYLVLLFPIWLGLTEPRYFLPFYHFHQLGLLYLVYALRRKKAVVEYGSYRKKELSALHPRAWIN